MTVPAPSIPDLSDGQLTRLLAAANDHAEAEAFALRGYWEFICTGCGTELGYGLDQDGLDQAIAIHQLEEMKKVASQ